MEKAFDVFLGLRRNRAVTLIHNESYTEVLDFFRILLVFTLSKLAHHGCDFLDSRHNHTLIISCQTLDQVMSIVRFVDVNDIIGRIREKGRGRLLVKVPTVDDKDGLLDSWDLQEVASHLVGGQGLTRTRGMPDIARFLTARGILNRLYGMNLIRT